MLARIHPDQPPGRTAAGRLTPSAWRAQTEKGGGARGCAAAHFGRGRGAKWYDGAEGSQLLVAAAAAWPQSGGATSAPCDAQKGQ